MFSSRLGFARRLPGGTRCSVYLSLKYCFSRLMGRASKKLVHSFAVRSINAQIPPVPLESCPRLLRHLLEFRATGARSLSPTTTNRALSVVCAGLDVARKFKHSSNRGRYENRDLSGFPARLAGAEECKTPGAICLWLESRPPP